MNTANTQTDTTTPVEHQTNPEEEVKVVEWDDMPMDDEPANAEDIKNNDPSNAASTADADKNAAANGEPDPNAPAPTALELFLAERGIVDGKLVYGEEEVAFKDLAPEDQLEVLKQLVPEQSEAPALEGDLKHIKDLMDAGKSIKDVAREILGDELSGAQQLSTDELNIRDIKEKYPTLTEEEIEIELEERKGSRLYEKKSEVLRDKFSQTQETDLAKMAETERTRVAAENEADRNRILTTVSELKDVDGWEINDDIKNYVLEDLIETDEQGNSKFVNIQDDPKEQFKMAYYYKMMPQIVNYFQQQITQAYEKGKAEIVGGFPAKPISNGGTGSNVNVQNNNQRVRGDHEDNLMTVTELG